MILSAKRIAVFWSRVDKRAGTECWPWNGTAKGYGTFWLSGKKSGAHRIAFALTVCDPGELKVLHQCDNPPCCNPAHLFLGTTLDNSRDAVSKRRMQHGESRPNAKLTNESVLEIRRKYKRHRYGYRRLAREFGVSWSTIKEVILRRSWKLAELEVASSLRKAA